MGPCVRHPFTWVFRSKNCSVRSLFLKAQRYYALAAQCSLLVVLPFMIDPYACVVCVGPQVAVMHMACAVEGAEEPEAAPAGKGAEAQGGDEVTFLYRLSPGELEAICHRHAGVSEGAGLCPHASKHTPAFLPHRLFPLSLLATPSNVR
mgnify:CR=1 FL=1